ncbi:MAG: ATP-binding cassette domain-containing protein [Acidobacteriota bacterium]
MIRALGLTKRFGAVTALDGLTFALEAGGTLLVTGPSGSGKTTLLRLVAGLESPSAGELHLNGSLASTPRRLLPPERRGVGMVFQRPALWGHMTLEANLLFGLHRWERREARRRAAELLEAVGLEELAGRRPHQVSGGEAQRAAFARALAPRPRLLLLDEPFSNLDGGWAERMTALLATEIAAGGATLMLVSHQRGPWERICAGRMALERGRLAQEGGAAR